jgi:DNA repair photolyase
MPTEFREEPAKTALNRVQGMPFKWTLNPYMGCAHRCTFCYVRGFEERAGRPGDERYGRSLRVKTNVVEVLGKELGRRSWKGESVAIGTATDPYQPAEGIYRLTRGCLESLCEARNGFTLLTRGPMIVRDIDVLAEASTRAEVSISFSISTLDSEIWRKTEPGTAPPGQRLRALRELVEAGVKAGVAIAPLLPGLTDSPAQIEEIVRAAREAGATHLWCRPLQLKPGTKEHFFESLKREWPEQLEMYQMLYERPNLPSGEAKPMVARVEELRDRYEIADRRTRRLEPRPAAVQLPLIAG